MRLVSKKGFYLRPGRRKRADRIKLEVRKFIRASGLLAKADRVLIMFSGGPDSSAMLDLLSAYQSELSLHLHILYCNHQLRSEAAAEENFVAGQGALRNIGVTIRRLPVKEEAQTRGMGIEEAGRFLRYRAAAEVAETERLNKIAVAHTADDSAEWALINLVMGQTPRGLAGIPPMRGEVVRPILCLTRTQVMDYLQERGVSFLQDPTNVSGGFLRSRVRAALVPAVKAINPSFARSTARLSKLISYDMDFADSQYEEWRERAVLDSKGAFSIDRSVAETAPSAILARAIREGLLKAGSGERLAGADVIVGTICLLRSGASGRRLDVGRGITIRVDSDAIVVGREANRSFKLRLVELGKPVSLPEGRLSLTKERWPAALPGLQGDSGETVVMDADKVRGPLTVRPRKPGDWFIPLGLPGRKKIQDFFVDAKVPGRRRSTVPILTDAEKVLWVVGLRLDDRVKLSPNTKRVIIGNYQ